MRRNRPNGAARYATIMTEGASACIVADETGDSGFGGTGAMAARDGVSTHRSGTSAPPPMLYLC
jgi:hypothetical protein